MKKSYLPYIISVIALFLSVFSMFCNKPKDNDKLLYKDSSIKFKAKDGYLMWRYASDEDWNELLDLASIKGADGKDGADGKNGSDGEDGLNGKDVELKVEGNILYWKFNTDTEWIELFKFPSSSSDKPDSGDDDSGSGGSGDSDNKLNINTPCFKDKTICSPGTKVSVNVNDNLVLDFYVVSDDNSVVTLISKNNLGINDITTLAWYDSTSITNNYGPISLITTLNEVTADWTNIKPIANYEYLNSGVGYQGLSVINGITTITDVGGKNTTLSATLTRSRLLTREETNELGCTGTKNSCPTWLYNGLAAEQNSITPYGYWLLTSATNANAYNIRNTGLITTNSVGDKTGRGIRPVIMINK